MTNSKFTVQLPLKCSLRHPTSRTFFSVSCFPNGQQFSLLPLYPSSSYTLFRLHPSSIPWLSCAELASPLTKNSYLPLSLTVSHLTKSFFSPRSPSSHKGAKLAATHASLHPETAPQLPSFVVSHTVVLILFQLLPSPAPSILLYQQNAFSSPAFMPLHRTPPASASGEAIRRLFLPQDSDHG